jgi:hypothetical protein
VTIESGPTTCSIESRLGSPSTACSPSCNMNPVTTRQSSNLSRHERGGFIDARERAEDSMPIGRSDRTSASTQPGRLHDARQAQCSRRCHARLCSRPESRRREQSGHQDTTPSASVPDARFARTTDRTTSARSRNHLRRDHHPFGISALRARLHEVAAGRPRAPASLFGHVEIAHHAVLTNRHPVPNVGRRLAERVIRRLAAVDTRFCSHAVMIAPRCDTRLVSGRSGSTPCPATLTNTVLHSKSSVK